MERPTTFDELQASADQELARLEQERGQREAAAARVRQERERLRGRRESDRRRAVACAAFGFVWQVGAHHPWFVALPGFLLVAVGVAYWARSRGWHPAWGLLGVIPLLGVLVPAFFPDRLGKRLLLMS